MVAQNQKLRQQQGAKTRTLEEKTATPSVAVKDIRRLRWEEGKKAPEKMSRGSAVVDGNTVYINPGASLKVYSCNINSWDQQLQWSTLPDTEYYNSSLVVIDGTLTSVGGFIIYYR